VSLNGLQVLLGPDFKAVFPVVLNMGMSGQVGVLPVGLDKSIQARWW
jgi:hypothetical protein